LERGKRYALVGASGAGKSTLLRVLAGLYAAESISIDQDGGPAILASSDVAAFLRATTTLIPQDAEVFEASLGENLSLCATLTGAPGSSECLQALQVAGVDEFIAIDAQALELQIAERAANWSGGQRARVALARGVLAAAGSSLVLLDEPTASLDLNSELRVYERVFAHFQDSCLVSSVHRLHLLDRFDEVLVMHGGRLVAQGPAALLSTTSPEFRQLLASYEQHSALLEHARRSDEREGLRLRSLSRR
jgi:ATP-binding cassette, subfamily B, bacterial